MSQAADQILIQRLVMAVGLVCCVAGIVLFLEARWLLVVGEETVGQVVDHRASTGSDGAGRMRYRPVIEYHAEGDGFRHFSRQTYHRGARPSRGTQVEVYYRAGNPSYARTPDEMGMLGTTSLIAYALLGLGVVIALGGGPALISMLARSDSHTRLRL